MFWGTKNNIKKKAITEQAEMAELLDSTQPFQP